MTKSVENPLHDVIDLGSVTEATKGSLVGFEDQQGGQRIAHGLSDD